MQYKTEYTVFRHYDRAHELCREFLDGSTGHAVDTYARIAHDTDYIVIFDSEESAAKPYYRRTQLKAMRRAALLEVWQNHFNTYLGSDTMNKAELIDDLVQITRRQYYADDYDQNYFDEITEFDFVATGYSQGGQIKVCNADDNPYITAKYISNLFFDSPIHAEASIYKRADSDSAWELVDDFYLGYYTDPYEPSFEEVYQSLMAEKNPLAHMVAYDMPADIFENVE